MEKREVIKTTFIIPKSLHRLLKFQAVHEERKVNDLVIDAVKAYLKLYQNEDF